MLSTKADLLIESRNGLLMAIEEIERLLEIIEELEMYREPTDNIVLQELEEIIEKIDEELNV